MVLEAKSPFDDRSHPCFFDEFPGFHATWEADDEFGDGIDLPESSNDKKTDHNNVHNSVHYKDGADKEEKTLQKCLPKTLCSRKHLAGADWMNDPKDS